MTKTSPSPSLLPLIGQVVSYYDKGWRFGRLLGVKGQTARVKHPVTGVHKIPAQDIHVVTSWHQKENKEQKEMGK